MEMLEAQASLEVKSRLHPVPMSESMVEGQGPGICIFPTSPPTVILFQVVNRPH